MSKCVKPSIRAVTLSLATALFVGATAVAAPPSSPILVLTGHSNSNAYHPTAVRGVAGLSYSIDGSASFDSNGDLTGLADRSACGTGNASCEVLDGSGDGMLMYLVKDANGKKHINQIIGQNGGSGLFLSELFVEFSGGGTTSVDSIASKYVIKDAAELASAGSGFHLSAQWLRGDYQQGGPSHEAPDTPVGSLNRGLGTDMSIGYLQTFNADGILSENGAVPQAGLTVGIQSGTTADNAVTNAEDAQAMSRFHNRGRHCSSGA